jgi:hypothetical protein
MTVHDKAGNNKADDEDIPAERLVPFQLASSILSETPAIRPDSGET